MKNDNFMSHVARETCHLFLCYCCCCCFYSLTLIREAIIISNYRLPSSRSRRCLKVKVVEILLRWIFALISSSDEFWARGSWNLTQLILCMCVCALHSWKLLIMIFNWKILSIHWIFNFGFIFALIRINKILKISSINFSSHAHPRVFTFLIKT